ncbi:MAG: hypothetical protein GY786_00825, partial [Proteobacteria bacterium]|nr:hypothetical protein [Pseudomonadota bacterium]
MKGTPVTFFRTLSLIMLLFISTIYGYQDIPDTIPESQKIAEITEAINGLVENGEDPGILYHPFLFGGYWRNRYYRRRMDLVKILRDKEIKPPASLTTPLILATLFNDTENMKVHAGANVDAVDTLGKTALFYAVDNGSLEAVNILLAANSNCNIVDLYGNLPLSMIYIKMHEHQMYQNGTDSIFDTTSYNSIKELLFKQTDLTHISGFGNSTFLHFAVHHNNLANARKTLAAGVLVDFRNSRGETALSIAAQQGNVEMMQLLKENGASFNQKSNNGRIAIDHALRSG